VATSSSIRSRPDKCPGVFRPWCATDGALVRLRLIGGRISPASLTALSDVAGRYGDGNVHLTRRANLQVRGLPASGNGLPTDVVEAIAATGLLPSSTHELVRNVMVSPQTGLSGGHTDLRPVAAELDERLCADRLFARLPGRFLFVLDDGRGDLVGRSTDLGLVAVDHERAQLRIGSLGWGPAVSLADAAGELTGLAARFLEVRGQGSEAAWHVDELPEPLVPSVSREPSSPVENPPLPYGPVDGGEHVAAPGGVIDRALAGRLAGYGRELVVTPWSGVLVPTGEASR
jgi:precorrin-3B synthase